ncbi:MAG: dihydrofolate reductase [Ignavibacteriales bacterium]|nr:dihydrofolate reductase [Ignavibacteriales bacterium]
MVKYKLERIIIAAIAQNGVIGNKNKIPWHSREELKHFKKTTGNYPIIFGRKTFQSIGKSLPNRLNIVISSNLKSKNILTFNFLSKAYKFLQDEKYNKVFICGGERIYRSAIKYSEKMIISHMNFEAKGDRKFPKINFNLWNIVDQKVCKDFVVKYYERKKRT